MWNILIVDDEKNFAEDLKEEIGDYRFKGSTPNVAIAHSGFEAINILGQSEFALLIIDIIMETPDAGLHVIEFIRNKQKNSLMQIIVMTARPDIYEESDIISRYEIHSFIDKPAGLKRQYMLVISALRTYDNLIENIRLTEEAAINQRRLNILERSSLLDLTTEISSIREFAEIIFNIFVFEPGISGAALFEDDKLLKFHPAEEQNIEFYNKLYDGYAANDFTKQIIDDHVFLRIRELPDFVFVAGVDASARKNAAGIMSLAIVTRKILINIISDRRRIGPLAELVDLIEEYLYIQAQGEDKIIVTLDMEKLEIDLSFGSLFLFFDESRVLKISRSVAVNPLKVDRLVKHSSTDYNVVVGIDELPISKSRIDDIVERFSQEK